jgi:hypothetical protein
LSSSFVPSPTALRRLKLLGGAVMLAPGGVLLRPELLI